MTQCLHQLTPNIQCARHSLIIASNDGLAFDTNYCVEHYHLHSIPEGPMPYLSDTQSPNDSPAPRAADTASAARQPIDPNSLYLLHGDLHVGDQDSNIELKTLMADAEREFVARHMQESQAEIAYYLRVRQLIDHTNPATLRNGHIVTYANAKRWLLVEHMHIMILTYGGKFLA